MVHLINKISILIPSFLLILGVNCSSIKSNLKKDFKPVNRLEILLKNFDKKFDEILNEDGIEFNLIFNKDTLESWIYPLPDSLSGFQREFIESYNQCFLSRFGLNELPLDKLPNHNILNSYFKDLFNQYLKLFNQKENLDKLMIMYAPEFKLSKITPELFISASKLKMRNYLGSLGMNNRKMINGSI